MNCTNKLTLLWGLLLIWIGFVCYVGWAYSDRNKHLACMEDVIWLGRVDPTWPSYNIGLWYTADGDTMRTPEPIWKELKAVPPREFNSRLFKSLAYSVFFSAMWALGFSTLALTCSMVGRKEYVQKEKAVEPKQVRHGRKSKTDVHTKNTVTCQYP